MKIQLTAMVACLGVAAAWQAGAQTYVTNDVVVQTFAGSGFYGYHDGIGLKTMFNAPSSVVADASSNLFVLDSGNSLIRKITPDGTVSTYFNYSAYGPAGPMLIDRSNVLWFACGNNGSGLMRLGENGFYSQISLPFNGVGGICTDSTNNLYASDYYGNRIFRFNGASWELFAGSGNPGSLDGNWIFDSFYSPGALVADGADNVYVFDTGTHVIRKITQNQDVLTVAGGGGSWFSPDVDGVGTNAGFNSVSSMCMDDSGNLILACGYSIRTMTPFGSVATVAGCFSQGGYQDGSAAVARFANATSLCFSQGAIFVTDRDSQRIRKINLNGPVGQAVPAANLSVNMYAGIQINGIAGKTYSIESSTNLSAWTFEAAVVLTNQSHLWIDQTAFGQKKFYRAFVAP